MDPAVRTCLKKKGQTAVKGTACIHTAVTVEFSARGAEAWRAYRGAALDGTTVLLMLNGLSFLFKGQEQDFKSIKVFL